MDCSTTARSYRTPRSRPLHAHPKRWGPDGKTPEELVFDIEEGSGHILLDVERIIETHMMQLGIAEYAPDDTDRNVILNKPIFNTRKVNRLFNRAYNVGA
jgi:hypothetical protein